MTDKKIVAIVVVAVVIAAGIGAYALAGDKDTSKGGFYEWDPTVLEINGAYSNSTPSLVTLLNGLYEGIYGELPSSEGKNISDVPTDRIWPSDDYVTFNTDGTLTVSTYNSSSTGKTSPNTTTTIGSTAEKIVCYTAAYVDTIYNILCDEYNEDVGDSPQATAKLWEIVVGVSSDCKTGLEKNFDIDVPEDILIFDLGESLATYSEQLADECTGDENVVILMTEYNIRSTNAKITDDTVSTIENNTDGKVKFVFVLSNSMSMVISNTKMMGELMGINTTADYVDDLLLDIYLIQESIENMNLNENKSVYVETASGKAAGSGNLITNLLTDILGMDNIADSLTLMDSKLSDEQIVTAEPDVIIFYINDTRSMDERMRATTM